MGETEDHDPMQIEDAARVPNVTEISYGRSAGFLKLQMTEVMK